MSFYFIERIKRKFSTKQQLLVLGICALIFLLYDNLYVVGLSSNELLHLPFLSNNYNTIILSGLFLLYPPTAHYSDALDEPTRKKVRKYFWIVMIVYSLIFSISTGLEYENSLFFNLQLLFGGLLILYLCEILWRYGFDFGIEFFIAISGITNIISILFSPLVQNGEVRGLVIRYSDDLFQRGIYQNIHYYLVLYLAFIIVLYKFISSVQEKGPLFKGIPRLHILSTIIPVFYSLIATYWLSNNIKLWSIVLEINWFTSDIVNNSMGLLNPSSELRFLNMDYFASAILFIFFYLSFLSFFSLIYSKIWCKLILNKNIDKKTSKSYQNLTLKAGIIPLLGFLFGIPLGWTQILLLIVGIFLYLSYKFGNDYESKDLLLRGIIFAGIIGFILLQISSFLINSSTFVYAFFVAVLIILTLWFIGPYKIFQKIESQT